MIAHHRAKIGLLAAVLGFLMLAPHSANADVEGNKRHLPWNMVALGAKAYYKVYGHFPAVWADVVEAGIVQVQLSVPGAGIVDPDDSSLDFDGDLHYLAPDSSNANARIVQKSVNSPGVRTDELAAPTTYAVLLANLDQASGVSGQFSRFLDDESYLRLFAIASVANGLCMAYNYSNGHRPPTSVQELLDAGFLPVREDSINPVTGQGFNFDGGPDQIRVSLPDPANMKAGNSYAASVMVFDSEGNDLGLGWF